MSSEALVVINPMAFDGRGPSETCARIAKEWAQGSISPRIFAARCRRRPDGLDVRHPGRAGLSWLPYRYSERFLTSAAEWLSISHIEEGQICWVWPSASTELRQQLKDRGATMYYEMINAHTALDRRILDAEYAAEGICEPHHLSDDRLIEKQRRDLALSDVIFASNATARASMTEDGLLDSSIIDVSYGAYPQPQAEHYMAQRTLRSSAHGFEPVFLYVGTLCVRKGVHRLLRAWAMAGVRGVLVLAGQAESGFERHYSRLLAQDTVRCLGHVTDMNKCFRSADIFVFPSLSEGDPLVTHEAAAHGLPMIVSEMGGGRLARHGQNALVCNPYDEEAMAAAIRRIASEHDLRAQLGEQARRDSARFTWRDAANQRMAVFRERCASSR